VAAKTCRRQAVDGRTGRQVPQPCRSFAFAGSARTGVRGFVVGLETGRLGPERKMAGDVLPGLVEYASRRQHGSSHLQWGWLPGCLGLDGRKENAGVASS